MRFEPLTDEQLQISALLPEGIYSYKVVKSEDKVSQAGNEYISLTLQVYDDQGKEHLVFTNLALIKLLKHFCDINNLQNEYESGELPSNKCLNKSGGRVCISIEGEKPNPNGGVYKSKNIVKDYIADQKGSLMNPLPEYKDSFIDDALPF